MKCLVTVKSNDQSPTVKVIVCNIPISEIHSYCNSILRPADSNGVTKDAKGKVENSWACTFQPLVTCFHYTR